MKIYEATLTRAEMENFAVSGLATRTDLQPLVYEKLKALGAPVLLTGGVLQAPMGWTIHMTDDPYGSRRITLCPPDDHEVRLTTSSWLMRVLLGVVIPTLWASLLVLPVASMGAGVMRMLDPTVNWWVSFLMSALSGYAGYIARMFYVRTDN